LIQRDRDSFQIVFEQAYMSNVMVALACFICG